jgi:hypothetical protein
MPALTCRRDPDARQEVWLISHGNVATVPDFIGDD